MKRAKLKRKNIGFLKKICKESRRVVRGEMQHGSCCGWFSVLAILFLALFSTVVALWVVFVLFLTVGSGVLYHFAPLIKERLKLVFI